MARKNVLKTFTVFSAVDIASTQTSTAVNVEQLDIGNFFVSWTSSSIVGVLTVEGKIGDSGTWFTLDLNETLSINVDNSNLQILLQQMPFTQVRLKYTATSGTGNMTAVFHGKTTGA